MNGFYWRRLIARTVLLLPIAAILAGIVWFLLQAVAGFIAVAPSCQVYRGPTVFEIWGPFRAGGAWTEHQYACSFHWFVRHSVAAVALVVMGHFVLVPAFKRAWHWLWKWSGLETTEETESAE